MPLFGELFLSEIIKKPVFDPKGEITGRVKDIAVVKGDPLPKVSAIIVEKKNQLFRIGWEQINLFNKRIISTYLTSSLIEPYTLSEEDLLAVRDILDKQIVDANGAKVVRANDIKLEGYDGEAILIAVDVGVRGILRRLGIERGSEGFLKLFQTQMPYNLISWNYLQPLKPKLRTIALTVPRQMVSELHPADIAEIISQVSRDEGAHLFKDLDIETAAEALSELKPEMQADIINAMDAEKAADIIEEMPPDEAADVLSDLPAEKAKEILERIEEEESADIQELLHHEEGTAGSLMTNEFIGYGPDVSVRQAIESFRHDAEEIETVYYIYVTDLGGRLLGVTSLRELLLAEPDTMLAEIMETKIIKVEPDEDVEEAADLMSKYDLVAIPVVDKEGSLLGIVTIDDILDVIKEEATEDIYRIAGTSEVKFGNIEHAHPVHIVKSRLPWLLLCLLGGLISSIVISHFEKTLAAVVVLAAFVPVIMGMAGNAGLQVSTTMVRNIALNSISNYWRYIGKELSAGLMIAGITGITIAVASGILKGMPILGLVVGMSMFLSISSSTILAILAPAVADKIGIDPAITAGPFVTVFNDILGLTIYFTVATIFMKYLIF
ncbi:magnesium transporter [Dissulfurispira sp.]|uniref:magnesium transporter n=1 Tax=Dissulfurispira sp. TaxID=2817609 RepID=UPI002FD96C7C